MGEETVQDVKERSQRNRRRVRLTGYKSSTASPPTWYSLSFPPVYNLARLHHTGEIVGISVVADALG